MQDLIGTHGHAQQHVSGKQHTSADHDLHPRSQVSGTDASTNDETLVALKATVIQQATRIAELEAENRYLRGQIIEKQNQ